MARFALILVLVFVGVDLIAFIFKKAAFGMGLDNLATGLGGKGKDIGGALERVEGVTHGFDVGFVFSLVLKTDNVGTRQRQFHGNVLAFDDHVQRTGAVYVRIMAAAGKRRTGNAN